MGSSSRINGDLGPEGEAIREVAERTGNAIAYEIRQAIKFYVWLKAVLDQGGCVYTAPSPDGEKTRVILL